MGEQNYIIITFVVLPIKRPLVLNILYVFSLVYTWGSIIRLGNLSPKLCVVASEYLSNPSWLLYQGLA